MNFRTRMLIKMISRGAQEEIREYDKKKQAEKNSQEYKRTPTSFQKAFYIIGGILSGLYFIFLGLEVVDFWLWKWSLIILGTLALISGFINEKN